MPDHLMVFYLIIKYASDEACQENIFQAEDELILAFNYFIVLFLTKPGFPS